MRIRGITRLALVLVFLLINAVTARAVCVGDCNDSGDVKVDELVTSVNIALLVAPLSRCLAIETNTDGRATVNELITAVNNALHGCRFPTPTPTPTPPSGNQAPHVNAGVDVITAIDQTPTLTGSATDDGMPAPPGALTLQWTTVSGPGTVVFGSAGAATTAATFSRVGSYVLRLSANDGALTGSDDVTVHVDISAVNIAPTLDPVAGQTITPGTTLNLGLVGRDGNPFDALTYSLVSGPQGAAVGAQGIFGFTPLASQLGAHTVTVRVEDPDGLTAETSFDVMVVEGNRPPVFAPLADEVTALGARYTKTLSATDPDVGDTLTFALLSGPDGMTLNGAQLSWTRAAEQLGAFAVKVEVTDRAGSRDRGEFQVTMPLPGTILARDDAYEVVVNHTLSVPAPGVLGNDEDLAGSTLTANKLTDPDKGMLTAFNGDGSFTYVAPTSVETPPLLDVTTKYQLYDYGVLYSTHPPLVADLDGDGKPEIIFWILDDLYAVHGDTGELLFSAAALPEPYTGCAMYGRGNGDHFAVADIDDDGVTEIVVSAQCAADNPTYIYVAGNATRVLAIAFDAAAPSKFKVKWLSQPLAPQASIRPEDGGDGHLYVPFGTQAAFASYTIARLRPTEKPTILFGKTYSGFGGEFSYCGKVLPGKTDPRCRFVFALDGATGAVKTPYYSTPDDPAIAYSYDYTPYNGAFPPPIVADVDDDGQLDILYEGTLWEIDGTIKRQFDGTAATGPATADSAVVDLDGDAEMEILTLDNAEYRRPAYLKAWKPDGRLLWSLPAPGTTVVSPMSIADIDRSGHPSILFAVYDTLWAVDHTGRIKWLRRFPLTAGFWPIVNGAGMKFPVYDLNGDGIPEIVVQPNNQTILFLRGDTGDTQTSWSYPGQAEVGTQNVQAPVIADIDGSGHASLIWYHQVGFDGTTFLQVLKGDTVPWRPAPAHFNQRAYWETNFNLDGSVPTTYVRHTTDPKTNLFGQQPPAPYVTEPRLRTQTSFSYTATNGGLDSAPATVTIGILPENHPPVVTSTPPSAVQHRDYRFDPFTYQITAFDPDLGDVVAYELTYQGCGFAGAATVSSTGLFSCREFSQPESLCVFQVRLSDGHGGVTDHVFSISITQQTRTLPDVVGLQLPAARAALITADLAVGRVITVPDAAPAGQVLAQSPTGGTSVLRGTAVDLTVSAGPAPEDSDDDGDGFTERQGDCDDTNAAFSPGLPEVPGNGIDENCDGSERIVAEVVVAPATALRVTGEEVDFSATAVYLDRTSADVTATANWASAPTSVATISAGGNARALSIGTAAITATFGGAVGHASLTVGDRSAGDQDDPTAVITTPANGGSVTGLTQITGTATDVNFLRYELAVALATDTTFKTIGAGTSPVVDGVLGSFDPTMLVNDIYTVRLTVWDANGNQATAEVTVQVAGNQKVGNFSISFNDLSIALAGLPIEVVRTYDSRDTRRGDFGFGWTLQVNTLRLSTNRVLGTGWQVIKPGVTFGLQPTDAHFVSVTLADGRVEMFDLSIAPAVSPIVPFSFVIATFVPRPGTSGRLESLDNSNLLIADPQPGEVELLDDTTLNTYNPQRFRYTAFDGTQSEIHRTLGVQKVTDPNGNTLTFGANGITHSAGRSVTFARDAQGRITQITDPGGGTRSYAYDANGDLRTATDQANNATTYRYNATHGLLDITDPTGNHPARNEYDDEGRLIATIDAQGRRIEFTHDMDARQEVVTDRLGNVTVLEYDGDGNVVSRTNALGHRTAYIYDSRGNQLSEEDALHRVATKTYDEQNHLLSKTDVDGNTTMFTYDARGKVLTVTDPEGGVTTNTYDAAGNVATVTDPNGGVTRYTYDAAGNRLSTTDPLGRVTTSTYDASGNRLSDTDPMGRVTTLTYDANGNKVSESRTRTLPGGGMQTLTTQVAYDSLGRPTTTTDALGVDTTLAYSPLGDGQKLAGFTDGNGTAVSFEYDSRGAVTKTLYADGSATLNTYDAEGRLLSTTDRDGHTTTYQYDALRRQTAVTHPDGTTTRKTYDAVGRILTQADERGHTTAYGYGINQQTVTDAVGHVTVHDFDSQGRQVRLTDALGRITRYEYDGAGNLTQTTFADRSTSTSTYDLGGRKTADVDQAGRRTQYAYDGAGHLARVTDALAGVTSYAYDEMGNLVTQTDADGRITAMLYDALGRLSTRRRPLGQEESFTYDANGNALSHTDFNGDTTTFAYDEVYHLLSTTLPGNVVVSFAHTAEGHRTQAGGDSYAYDSRGRLRRDTKAAGGDIFYAYDAASNRTSVTTPQGTTTYTYDVLNRLATVGDATGTTTYSYDDVGNLASEARPNGVTTIYSYDVLNRLLQLTNNGPGGLISSYSYTLGPAGNRLEVVEAGPATTGRTVAYTYDALYRLTRESIDEPGAADDQTITYVYDAVGNRVRKTVVAGSNTTDILYTYDDNHRLLTEGTTVTMARALPGEGPRYVMAGYGLSPLLALIATIALSWRERDGLGRRARRRFFWTRLIILVLIAEAAFTPVIARAGFVDQLGPQPAAAQSATTFTYTYDDNGNTLSRSNGVSEDIYTYDAENRLAAADVQIGANPGPVTYTYDADGVRTSATVGGVTTTFLVDKNRDFAQVLTQVAGVTARTYTYGHDLLRQTRPGVGVSTFLRDGQHSTRQLIDTSGAVTDRYTFDAFGVLLSSTGTTPNNYLFAGEQLDPNVGFYYLRARYYAQTLGRFLTTDPEQGSVFDPVSLHRYLYANANPVTNRDPSGRALLTEEGIGLFIISVLVGIVVKVFSDTLITLSTLRRLPTLREFLKSAALGAVSGAVGAIVMFTFGTGLLAIFVGIAMSALISIYLTHLAQDLYAQDILNVLLTGIVGYVLGASAGAVAGTALAPLFKDENVIKVFTTVFSFVLFGTFNTRSAEVLAKPLLGGNDRKFNELFWRQRDRCPVPLVIGGYPGISSTICAQ